MNSPLKPLGIPPNAWAVNAELADITRPPLQPVPIQLDTATKTLRLDLAKAALIVVDMQNDFCHPDGWLAQIGVDVSPARTPIEPIQSLLPALRQAEVPVIWLNWGNRPDLLNIAAGLRHVYNPTGAGTGLGDPLPNGAPVLIKSSWAAAVVDELVIEPSDICVDKYRMSGFWDTALDSILRNLGRSSLFFGGVNADQCVMATLQDANFLGYDCILLSDCTATTSPDYCMQATLYNVKQCFGFVSDSSSLIHALSESQELT